MVELVIKIECYSSDPNHTPQKHIFDMVFTKNPVKSILPIWSIKKRRFSSDFYDFNSEKCPVLVTSGHTGNCSRYYNNFLYSCLPSTMAYIVTILSLLFTL